MNEFGKGKPWLGLARKDDLIDSLIDAIRCNYRETELERESSFVTNIRIYGNVPFRPRGPITYVGPITLNA